MWVLTYDLSHSKVMYSFFCKANLCMYVAKHTEQVRPDCLPILEIIGVLVIFHLHLTTNSDLAVHCDL